MSHHSEPVRRPVLYVASLTAGTGPRLLLECVADAALRGKPFMPSQARLGELFHRRRETVNRWARQLKERGWIRVIRRGKTLNNVYRLSRALWARITGQVPMRRPAWLKQLDLRMGERFALGARWAATSAAPAPASG